MIPGPAQGVLCYGGRGVLRSFPAKSKSHTGCPPGGRDRRDPFLAQRQRHAACPLPAALPRPAPCRCTCCWGRCATVAASHPAGQPGRPQEVVRSHKAPSLPWTQGQRSWMSMRMRRRAPWARRVWEAEGKAV